MAKIKEIELVKIGHNRFEVRGVASEQWAAKLEEGECSWMRPLKPRNRGHHRKLFALLKFTKEHSEFVQTHFKNLEELLDEVKILTGHFEVRYRTDGTKWPKPKSIAFDNMDQDEFQKFYDTALDVIWAKYFPDVRLETIREELAAFG